MNENKFSAELYKKKEDGQYDQCGFDTLQKLVAKVKEAALFSEDEEKELEVWKEMFPAEWELLQSQAFQDLSPREQQQVSFNYLKQHGEEIAQAIRLRQR